MLVIFKNFKSHLGLFLWLNFKILLYLEIPKGTTDNKMSNFSDNIFFTKGKQEGMNLSKRHEMGPTKLKFSLDGSLGQKKFLEGDHMLKKKKSKFF